MSTKWRFFCLIITLSLLAGCVLILNHDKQPDVLAMKTKRANPSSIYIKREIKTDLYAPADGPAPLTGWEMSGIGGNNEGMIQAKTSTTPQVKKTKASTDSSQAGNSRQGRDSLAAANRDSAASK